jgi:cytochrome c peroxidase
LRPTFMHDGQALARDDVMACFDRGGDTSGDHGVSEITPLGLTEAERADLVAFLVALEGPGPEAALLSVP